MRDGTRYSRAPSGVLLKSAGRLDLDELLRVKVIADRLRGAVTHLKILAHLRPAQVEVAVGETKVFIDLVTADIVERERRRVGNV